MKLNFIPEAFLFDLDGVIIDSESTYTEIWAEIDRHFPTGIENFPIKIKGTTLSNILSTYYPDHEVSRKVEQMLYDLEDRMVYKVIPGALALLNKLKEKGIPTALVTSSNNVKMAHLWAQQPQLREYFQGLITADKVSNSKPDPEGYLKGAEVLGADPTKCVVVEDSLQGVMAGENAGAFVIGVAGTLSPETLAPHANIVVEDLATIELPSF